MALPYPLVRKAKEMAVREDRSLNDYVREAIDEKIDRFGSRSTALEKSSMKSFPCDYGEAPTTDLPVFPG